MLKTVVTTSSKLKSSYDNIMSKSVCMRINANNNTNDTIIYKAP